MIHCLVDSAVNNDRMEDTVPEWAAELGAFKKHQYHIIELGGLPDAVLGVLTWDHTNLTRLHVPSDHTECGLHFHHSTWQSFSFQKHPWSIAKSPKIANTNMLLGKRVGKCWNGRMFRGKIVSYRVGEWMGTDQKLWKVVYQDGDVEEYSTEEIVVIIR